MKLHNPASPGRILSLYLDGLTVTEAAKKLDVTRVNLSKILNGHSGISPEMALKLSKAFDNSPMFWLNLNSQYELWKLSQKQDEILANVTCIV
jgi:antitoxin HigA-1